MVLLQEIVGFKAHVSTFGSVEKKFEAAAQAIKANLNFTFQVKIRAVQDKFMNIMSPFYKKDKRDKNKSGPGGELSFSDEQFCGIVGSIDFI